MENKTSENVRPSFNRDEKQQIRLDVVNPVTIILAPISKMEFYREYFVFSSENHFLK
jgi:hypothetical protein